jgi:ABC-2 type transport system permease protein
VKKIWIIIKKEWYSYFASPIFYTVVFIFLLLTGYFFYTNVAYFSLISFQAGHIQEPGISLVELVIEPLVGYIGVILLLLLPLLTMRLLAEERRQGNLELLLTYPVREIELVLGKFFGCVSIYIIMLVFVLIYPLLLLWVGRPDVVPFFTGYLGLLLMGGAFIALGLFISSLTENQVVAAALTFGLLLFFWIIDWVAYITEPPFSKIFEKLSLFSPLSNFARGIIDTKDIVFYLSFIIFGLFLTLHSLEAQYSRR